MQSNKIVSISFIGDISLNDSYIDLYNQKINPFANLKPVLGPSDFVIGNLECMVKTGQGENELKKPRLTTNIETLNYLKNINLSVAFLAQNHVYDHLEDGFTRTTDFLDSNEILHLGAGHTQEEADKPIVLNKRNVSIALLNYVTSDTNPNMPADASICLNMFDLEKCKTDILKLKGTVNHIVISLHWGGRVEGGFYPDWEQPKIAKELIDTGADLIIGHHSHTIQPYEVYQGKHIFYSLGNFCFSDYWFNGVFHPMPRRRMVTAIINISFSRDNYTVKPVFFHNERIQFSRYDYYEQKLKQRNLIFRALLSKKYVWNFYFFYKQSVLPLLQFFGRKDISLSIKLARAFKYVSKK